MMFPIKLNSWLQENAEKLKPPVNNFCIQKGEDFIVMAVGSPNQRTDYHINPTEEWFYQYKGDMILKIVNPENGNFEDIHIKEGELFLLPANVPHNPVRPYENSVGLVIERMRPVGKRDLLRWYCDKCKGILYENSFVLSDITIQIKECIETYKNSIELRTCKKCFHLNKV